MFGGKLLSFLLCRVDGAGRPKFDFHTGPAGTIQAASVADANAQFSASYYPNVPEGTSP